jgi:hypothetical protein
MKAQRIHRTRKVALAIAVLIVVGLISLSSGCAKKPDWAAKNDEPSPTRN